LDDRADGGVLKDLTVGKQGYLVQVLPPEVVAFNREVELERTRQTVTQTTLRLATAHPALLPVIELHSPELSEYGTVSCQGCDAGAYAEDDPEWPCSTIELILDGLGPHIMHNGRKLSPACGKRYMDGRNEVRCWLPEAHDGECK
jgi:hypothetical protein